MPADIKARCSAWRLTKTNLIQSLAGQAVAQLISAISLIPSSLNSTLA